MIGPLLRSGPVTAIACAVLLGTVPLRVAAQVEPPAPAGPVAIIGSSIITDTEIDRIAAGRPRAYADLPPDARRARIIDEVVAEYVIDYSYGRDTSQLSPAVLDALNDARRQVLLQFYAQSKFTPPEVTETDVADFIARNPGLFADRYSFSFAVVTLSGGTAPARQALQDRVQALAAQPEGQIAALNDLVAGKQADGVIATVNTVWQPSEALDDDLRSRLEAMVEGGRQIDIVAEPDAASILLLNSAVPIAADPALLRDRIEQRLIAEAFGVHRADLVRRMAQTVLDPAAARDAKQAPGPDLTVDLPLPGEVVWSSRPAVPRKFRLAALFSAGLSWTFAGYLLWAWLRLVLAQYRLLVNIFPEVPFLRRRSTGVGVTALGASALLGSAGAAVPIALQTLGWTATGLVLGSSVATGLALAVVCHVWSQRAFNQLVEQEDDNYDSIEATRQILFRKRKSVRILVGSVAFAGLYALSLTVFLDAPVGPS